MTYQAYLDLLKGFLEDRHQKNNLSIFLKKINAELSLNSNQKFKLLSSAHLIVITFGQNNLLEYYLNLLYKTLTESSNTISSQEIYLLLSTSTADAWTLGNYIAFKIPELIGTYISLLITLKENNKLTLEHIHTLQRIKSIVIYREEHEVHSIIIHIITLAFTTCLLYSLDEFPKKRTSFLFVLLTNQLLPYKPHHSLLNYKDDICEYILGLTDNNETKKQKKLTVLQNALNPQHPLGEFFATPRGKWKTDYDAGTLNRLTETFLQLLEFNNPEKLYQFLYTNQIDFTTQFNLPYAVLLSQKTALCDYLCNDLLWLAKTTERVKAITTALKPDTPLGKLIWCKRSSGTPTKKNGSRAKLIEKLKILMPNLDLSFIPDFLITPTNLQPKTTHHSFAQNDNTTVKNIINQWDVIKTQGQSTITNFIPSLAGDIDSHGYTLGHRIADSTHNSLNKDYLKLILAVLKKDPTTIYDIFNFLNIRTLSGWNIGNLLATKQSASTINLYLEILLKLQAYGLPIYLLQALECIQSIKKSPGKIQTITFTDCLAQNTTKNIPAVIARFLFNNFLSINPSLLARKDAIRDFLLTFETLTEEKQQTALALLNKIFTPNTMLNQYFLTPRGSFEPTYHSGTLKPLKNKFLKISGFIDPQTLYQALINNKFAYSYEIVSEQKEVLFIYLLSLPQETRKATIKNALNPNHSLGKVFWLQRGSTPPSNNAGVLLELQDAYDNFNIWNNDQEMQALMQEINTSKLTLLLPDKIRLQRKNLRNYILAHADLTQKLTWLMQSLDLNTSLGIFFGNDILTPSTSPRMLYLFKALLYFASTPAAKKTKSLIYLASPFDEIYYANLALPTAKPDQKNSIELSSITITAHTMISAEVSEEKPLLQAELEEEELAEEEDSAEEVTVKFTP